MNYRTRHGGPAYMMEHTRLTQTGVWGQNGAALPIVSQLTLRAMPKGTKRRGHVVICPLVGSPSGLMNDVFAGTHRLLAVTAGV